MSFVKDLAKTLLSLPLRCFNRKKFIIFESTPDFADNTYPVYEQMVSRGLGQRYTFVWSCSKDQTLPDEGVRYIYPQRKGLKEKLRNAYYMANASCMICCNRYLLPWHKKQVAVYLSHGTPLKSVRGYYTMPQQMNYCLAAAPDVAEMMAYEFNTRPDKVVPLGFPRNDVLTQPRRPVKQMLETTCKKVIVWYPTFRQHKNGLIAGSGEALPVIHDGKVAAELNEWAKKMDVLLVLKPHFAQDVSEIKDLKLSNIRFIDDAFFRLHGITSYEFVAGCDAMITDYSSIYYDYLLCDRPVGLVWEDLEEYRAKPGFAVDIEEYCAGGVKIYDLADFKEFLRQVALDQDVCQQARRRLRDMTNYSTDGQNAQRVTDFIIEKANL